MGLLRLKKYFLIGLICRSCLASVSFKYFWIFLEYHVFFLLYFKRILLWWFIFDKWTSSFFNFILIYIIMDYSILSYAFIPTLFDTKWFFLFDELSLQLFYLVILVLWDTTIAFCWIDLTYLLDPLWKLLNYLAGLFLKFDFLEFKIVLY
jgi:hypothetical protein